MNIKVYDAMMGSGKTTNIIQSMKEAPVTQKFMFITPLLTECHRIAGTTYELGDQYKRPIILDSDETSILYQYEDNAPLRSKLFKHPYFSKVGGKAESLPQLIKNNDNIVSTHQLFVNLTPKILAAASEYILVIDEMISVYEIYTQYSLAEITTMLSNKWITLSESDGITLKFHRENYGISEDPERDPTENTYYESFANLCDLGQLMLIDGKVVVWELAADALTSFKEVWIATYMFEDNVMSTYLKAHNIQYEIVKFGNKPSDIKHLINIYEDSERSSLNTIGNKDSALSATHSKGSSVRDLLANNLDNYIRNKVKCKKSDLLWTCFKEGKSRIQKNTTNNYTNQWLASNTKATNAYGDIHNVVYLCNIYPNPELIKASSARGFSVNEQVYALSEMVQFIWRSAVRNGEAINIYIPSLRMRTLLKRWLNNEFETNVKE